MDRFSVDDPRSAAEIDEEDKMRIRVKQAYKSAKQAASKKREKDRFVMTAVPYAFIEPFFIHAVRCFWFPDVRVNVVVGCRCWCGL